MPGSAFWEMPDGVEEMTPEEQEERIAYLLKQEELQRRFETLKAYADRVIREQDEAPSS